MHLRAADTTPCLIQRQTRQSGAVVDNLPDFPNPQHDPGMERRLLLVFALTFLVIIAFQPLLRKYLPQAPPPAAKTETQSPAPSATGGNPPPAVQAQRATPNSVPTKQATAESETVIENDLYRITFSNRGGQVKSWVLKKYDDEHGNPLELINASAAQKYG